MDKEKVHIVKIGGKLVSNQDLLEQFLVSFSQLHGRKILVHGGGGETSDMSRRLNLDVRMIDGRRITDTATLEVAVMVYAGTINKRVVALLQALGTPALGFSGADLNLIRAEKRPVRDIDYGWVGDIVKINDHILHSLLIQDIVPVFSPITHDGTGQLLNTNADTISCELAIALTNLCDVSLSYCFEFEGVLVDPEKPESGTWPRMRESDMTRLIQEGKIHSGMMPKLTTGFKAASHGVKEVHVCGVNNLICHTDATRLLPL